MGAALLILFREEPNDFAFVSKAPTEDALKGYGGSEPSAGPPASGAGRVSRGSEPEGFEHLADQLGPAARPTSAQSAPMPSKNGFGDEGGPPKEWEKGPAVGGGPAGAAAARDAGGPGVGGPGAGQGGGTPFGPSSRSTPLDFGKSPISNGMGGLGDFAPSGRSSGNFQI